MRRFRFARLAIANAFVAAVAVEAARPQYGGTLRVETRATIRTLDPVAQVADPAEAVVARRIQALTFEPLMQVDPAGGLRPLVAASLESDEAGSRWRVRLRTGIMLHDGRPLEGWQVAASLRATGHAWTVSLDGDDVLIDTARPEPGLAWDLADLRSAIVVRDSPPALNGTGPFRIERLEANRLLLRAHDAYWSGRPFVDAVRVEMGHSLPMQLGDLEAGRADVVELQASDTHRITDRGLRVAATRPLDVFLLVFEPHRAARSYEAMRRRFARALAPAVTADILLQGRAAPARALLPPWLSGYSPELTQPSATTVAQASGASVSAEQRNVVLRVDSSDAIARGMAERIAVDAREAGFVVTVQQQSSGLAPRPDVRLVRVSLEVSSPDRALARLALDLGSRTVGLATSESAPPRNAPLEAVLRFERALLQNAVIVPIVHVRQLYGMGEAVDVWDGQAVSATGAWNFANIWMRR
jgi:MarR-like DNA-binding transcriptional regulator SgrR of sgrS sRNA